MIGRKHEAAELLRLYESGKAELVVVYGRRRVGKTYLVDEVLEGKFTFKHAGLSPATDRASGQLRAQLDHFCNSLDLHGMELTERPDNWLDAFLLLEKFVQSRDDGTRQVVFLDELPWMDTPRSGFLQAFEAFWNTWGCHRKNLMVVVCGSANSWVMDKFVNNHGGLYNRVTYEIKLSPFTLKECEEFYRSIGVVCSRYDITQSYMILGGIPYYMGYMEPGMSFAQNVDKLFFTTNARLRDEFNRLFDSVFTSPEAIKAIVRLLYTRSAGFTRKEIVEKLGLSDGGRLSLHLRALVASDFVVSYVPFGRSKRDVHFKLVDPFCLFYLHFVQEARTSSSFWQEHVAAPSVVAWRGLAFENVCFNHVDQLKQALGVSGVITTASAWVKRANEEDDARGTQIDLLLQRNDNVVNLCEMKFYGGDFTVDGNYYRVLLGRQSMLSEMVSPKIAVRNTLVTTFGLTRNEYSGVFTNVITMDDLFA